MKLKGKKVTVVGLARSGLALARFLLSKEARVTATDLKSRKDLEAEVASLETEGVRLALGSHPPEVFLEAELIVVSPGVATDLPELVQADRAGIEVISEVELAYRFLKAPLLAVTGTNGKSTTTTLLGEILSRAGLKVFTGGNLGKPLIKALKEEPGLDFALAEISSFQLERIVYFRPRVAVFLNLTPDHLDRHLSYDQYASAKARIFMNQQPEDVAVINKDDPEVVRLFYGQARLVGFGRKEGEVLLTPEGITSKLSGQERVYPLEAPGLCGVHNQENAMAAVAVAEICGVQPRAIAASLTDFAGLPHRLEVVRRLRGVTYINDSKATNIGAVQKSLASFDQPVILIAGGKDKATDYRLLLPQVKEKVRGLILFGQASEKLKEALGTAAPTVVVEDLEQAVSQAAAWARPDEVVLLSPACASFDMFTNFEERGERFKQLVAGLN